MIKHQDIEKLKEFLDQKVELYNTPSFIENDPISVPHRFKKQQDIEIMGFFAAIFAWGQRKTIINKSIELAERMDNSPYDFITNHKEEDLKALLGFKHRTFNDTDLLYSIHFLKHHFNKYNSLEDAFIGRNVTDVESALTHFHQYFFSLPEAPSRTHKHIPSPLRGSACKRINMYLRWMVRKDNKGVDFGIWDKLKPSQLICPLDLHVERTAHKINLLNRDKADWKAALELTQNLRLLDKSDPVKYDFALFAISIEESGIIDLGQIV